MSSCGFLRMKPHLDFWYSCPQTPIPARDQQINPISGFKYQYHRSNSERKTWSLTISLRSPISLQSLKWSEPNPAERNQIAKLGPAYYAQLKRESGWWLLKHPTIVRRNAEVLGKKSRSEITPESAIESEDYPRYERQSEREGERKRERETRGNLWLLKRKVWESKRNRHAGIDWLWMRGERERTDERTSRSRSKKDQLI